MRYKIQCGRNEGQSMRVRFTTHGFRFTRLARGALLALLTLPLFAEGQGNGRRGVAEVPYNGRITFTRIRYGSNGFRRGSGAWAHDYPNADRHISTLLEYLTTIYTLGVNDILYGLTH